MSERKRITGEELANNARLKQGPILRRSVVDDYLDCWVPLMEAASKDGRFYMPLGELPTLRNGATDSDMRQVYEELRAAGIVPVNGRFQPTAPGEIPECFRWGSAD